MPTNQGSLRLFRLAGIEVFLHWSWFLVAVWEIQAGARRFSNVGWSAAEYLALFLIVLLHEFGHALACRQVGGKAERIVLWPFGGVAYVQPPQRPGATLWSIAAGPLVNVALMPVLLGLGYLANSAGWYAASPDFHQFVRAVSIINAILFVFNILPIYPLDGGQILRSLLWFVIGRARSLMVATVIGFVGIAGYFALAVWLGSFWMIGLAIFLFLNCWAGLQSARVLARIMNAPRRENFACPACHAAPPMGENWKCSTCKQPFDTFVTLAKCPHCYSQFPRTQCFECGQATPIAQWTTGSAAAANP
ncbi:MAG TPA: site-2 protease family protein [Terriglobales bacterium]|nr:site-2 protease family protein [Terriglobales bacterium]